MREVVEHQPGYGDGSVVLEARRAGQVLEFAAVWEERERDEGLEVAAVVGGDSALLAKAFGGFDAGAEERHHGDVGLRALLGFLIAAGEALGLVARKGDAAAGTGGAVFSDFGAAALNGAGDTAFSASLIGTGVTSA
ncbi:MAG: hypothetical protein ACNA8P_10570, partial [Phycisphaerales bacterium]